MSSHDGPHYHPSPNVTETRTASLAVKSAPDAEGYWWARWRDRWEVVEVDDPNESSVFTMGGNRMVLEFDAWIGPLEPPTVTP